MNKLRDNFPIEFEIGNLCIAGFACRRIAFPSFYDAPELAGGA